MQMDDREGVTELDTMLYMIEQSIHESEELLMLPMDN